MVAHVSFPVVDPLPASFSSWWLQKQLRDDLGFGGAIVSDDIAMAGANAVGSCAQRAVKAIAAGCDMILLCNSPGEIPAVIDAFEGYMSPPSQLHLMRLRGQRRQAWRSLRSSAVWREARRAIENLSATPQLRLEG